MTVGSYSESAYLAKKMTTDTPSVCGMQIVFADIVAYSRRKTHQQVRTVLAFTNCFREALSTTASAYTEQMTKLNTHLQRDIVIVPTGDGVAVGFPFDIPGISLDFVDRLVTAVHTQNTEGQPCAKFDHDDFCDCHSSFRLRIGMSEGLTVLYRDLNDRINIAGTHVNLAARVMGLAQPDQVLLTDHIHQTIVEYLPGRDVEFRKYSKATVKHDLQLDVHQYINDALTGLDVDFVAGLDPSGSEDVPRTAFASDARDPGEYANSSPDADSEIRREKPGPSTGKSRLPMVRIGDKQFTMGTTSSGRVDVCFSRPILISARLVTQQDYESVVGTNPSQFVAPTNPVERVSWFDAANFCNALSMSEGYPGVYQIAGQVVTVDDSSDGYRLPTEAEWELCCRGDAGEDRYGPIDDIAWYSTNSKGASRPVGELRPNRGIFDLLGNVWEWCNDWYQRSHPEGLEVDYTGPASGYQRVIRGGSWRDQPGCISADFRGHEPPSKCDGAIGFRIVRVPGTS